MMTNFGNKFTGEGAGEPISLDERRKKMKGTLLQKPESEKQPLVAQKSTELAPPSQKLRHELSMSPTTAQEAESLQIAAQIVGDIVEGTSDEAEAIALLSALNVAELEFLNEAIKLLTEQRLAHHIPGAQKFAWTRIITMAIERTMQKSGEI
ncbi:MAG TPA: hypothetical protein VI957_01255 [Candidatus Paceibacterota bacterium]